MKMLGFKKWLNEAGLDKEQPDTPNIWDSGNNADKAFGLTGIKSKNAMTTQKGMPSQFDPDDIFFCGKKKKKMKKGK